MKTHSIADRDHDLTGSPRATPVSPHGAMTTGLMPKLATLKEFEASRTTQGSAAANAKPNPASKSSLANLAAAKVSHPVPLSIATDHPLDPRGDETIAKIIGRYETRAFKQAEAKTDNLLSDVYFKALRRLKDNKKISREELALYAEEVHREFSTPGLALCFLQTNRAKMRSAASFKSVCLHLSTAYVKEIEYAVVGHVQLRLTSCEMSRKSILYKTAPLTCDWRHHAAERLHQRGNDRGDAHRTIGKRIMEVFPIINVLSQFTAEIDIDMPVAVPLGGGLLYGALSIAATEHMMPAIESSISLASGGARYQEFGFGHLGFSQYDQPLRQIAGQNATPAEQPGERAKSKPIPTWTALTFIGANDMNADQRAYIAAFEDVLQTYFPDRRCYDHLADPAVESDDAGSDDQDTSGQRPSAGGIVAFMPREDLFRLKPEVKASFVSACNRLVDMALIKQIVRHTPQNRLFLEGRKEQTVAHLPKLGPMLQTPFDAACIKIHRLLSPHLPLPEVMLKRKAASDFAGLTRG